MPQVNDGASREMSARERIDEQAQTLTLMMEDVLQRSLGLRETLLSPLPPNQAKEQAPRQGWLGELQARLEGYSELASEIRENLRAIEDAVTMRENKALDSPQPTPYKTYTGPKYST